MNMTGQPWQYAIVTIALAASFAGVLLHLFPRLHAGARRILGRVLSHPAMPTRLQRVAQRWTKRWATSPRGGCAGCASRGADAPRAIATVAMPARRSAGRGRDQAR
ncbi:DUF6587 family protein [Bordetella sp. LUAb4]|uniref:DUF6587 family protein n=1 Tax=Bordetella sp. LUAb4 TaxID=2843195 RepID=UPI001E36FA25|nr:DUF6587 family protein [Bordetella sp. LUAb4]